MTYRMRPRFELSLDLPIDQAMQGVSLQLERPECPCEGEFRSRHILLFISEEVRKFWSPFVSMEFNSGEQPDTTRIRGVIGPAPNVWIMFMSGYAFLGFLTFVALMLGISQLIIRHDPWGFYVLPGLGLLVAGWYGLSQLGKRLASREIEKLHCLLDEAFKGHVRDSQSKT